MTSRNDSDAALRAIRGQAAVVRTLASEVERAGGSSEPGVSLRAQAVEESARLASALEGLSKARHAIPPSPDAQPRAYRPREGRRAHLLVVEDDESTRVALAQALASQYEVAVASNGAEGLKVATERSFDAIITDVRMPEMDGVTMVERLRRIYGSTFVPVVFLTAESAPERITDGFSAGATSYMVKPVDLDLLEAELRWVLGSSSR